MPITFSEKFIAYLALLSGLAISVVAEYYSILGLTAIFSSAFVPVVIMGIALGIGKLAATVWLKQNWEVAPWSLRLYLMIAIVVLMLITSMGIFGFLSKAHSDQNLITGDAQAKLLIYEEKIKTARENIQSLRNELKQLDAAVDQLMARSTTEQGASRSETVRRNQTRDRARISKEIENNQSVIVSLNEQSAPLRAEVRKIEAEVGPIKYIANFVYGETDQTILEKAVTWVIIILIVVFDPLAVILLLASQISFQNFRERKFKQGFEEWTDNDLEELSRDSWVADVGEKPTAEELAEIATEGDSPEKESDVVSTATVTEPAPHHPDTHPYLRQGFKYPEGWVSVGPMPAVIPRTDLKPELTLPELVKQYGYSSEKGIVRVAGFEYTQTEFDRLMKSGYVQNEEQVESGTWNKVISEQEYREQVIEKQNESKNNTGNTA